MALVYTSTTFMRALLMAGLTFLGLLAVFFVQSPKTMSSSAFGVQTALAQCGPNSGSCVQECGCSCCESCGCGGCGCTHGEGGPSSCAGCGCGGCESGAE